MKRIILGVLLVLVTAAHAKTVTYNHLEEVNLQDQGIPSDERAMNVLIADGDMVYGATSGDKCHIVVSRSILSVEGRFNFKSCVPISTLSGPTQRIAVRKMVLMK